MHHLVYKFGNILEPPLEPLNNYLYFCSATAAVFPRAEQYLCWAQCKIPIISLFPASFSQSDVLLEAGLLAI